jgi:hypothetical protein
MGNKPSTPSPYTTSSLGREDATELCPRGMYGWIRDMFDPRDRSYAKIITLSDLSRDELDFVDTGESLIIRLPAYDQGNLNTSSCQAVCFLLEFFMQKSMGMFSRPSRLEMYYNATQSGCLSLRDTLKQVQNQGFMSEGFWPYVSDKVHCPPKQLFQSYKPQLEYFRLDNTHVGVLRDCLEEGFPFIFGMSVYTSFNADLQISNKVTSEPDKLLGSQNFVCVGYEKEDESGHVFFTIRNSRGLGFGEAGHFYISSDLIRQTDICGDFWTIR